VFLGVEVVVISQLGVVSFFIVVVSTGFPSQLGLAVLVFIAVEFPKFCTFCLKFSAVPHCKSAVICPFQVCVS
jgi:hypothetical protein